MTAILRSSAAKDVCIFGGLLWLTQPVSVALVGSAVLGIAVLSAVVAWIEKRSGVAVTHHVQEFIKKLIPTSILTALDDPILRRTMIAIAAVSLYLLSTAFAGAGILFCLTPIAPLFFGVSILLSLTGGFIVASALVRAARDCGYAVVQQAV